MNPHPPETSRRGSGYCPGARGSLENTAASGKDPCMNPKTDYKKAPKIARDFTMAETKIYGRSAAAALWQNRASDIIRVYVSERMLGEFGPLLKWCAGQRKAYHVVPEADLAKLAASVHHEGIVILTKERPLLGDIELLQRVASIKGNASLLYLDGVGNPHNIGALLRTAAHFGCHAVIGPAQELPRLSPSTMRTAEGGAEHVTVAALTNAAETIEKLKQMGFALVATSSHATKSLYIEDLPRRVIFVLGGETGGASAKLLGQADQVLKIPGTGAVESLNVSVAGALMLGEFWRRHGSER